MWRDIGSFETICVCTDGWMEEDWSQQLCLLNTLLSVLSKPLKTAGLQRRDETIILSQPTPTEVQYGVVTWVGR